jgi:hypothetical protein
VIYMRCPPPGKGFPTKSTNGENSRSNQAGTAPRQACCAIWEGRFPSGIRRASAAWQGPLGGSVAAPHITDKKAHLGFGTAVPGLRPSPVGHLKTGILGRLRPHT